VLRSAGVSPAVANASRIRLFDLWAGRPQDSHRDGGATIAAFMKKVLPVLFFLLLSYYVTPAQTPHDEPIRVDTSLVLVPVSVTDEKGRFIPNLKKEDFKLFDDGKLQEIAHFDTVDAPFTVVIMLDMSDSTRFKLSEIQAAAQAFVDQLRPADKIALFTFDEYVFKALEVTADRKAIREAIRLAHSGGGTSLYSAVAEVTGKYLKNIKGRKAIVLFTDGIDTTSPDDENYAGTLKMAQETDAIVFPIQYDTTEIAAANKPDPNAKKLGMAQKTIVTARGEPVITAYKRGTQYMRQLASQSGGKFQFADSLDDLTESFARIARELKEQYSLGFYPAIQTADGKQRDLKVQYTGDSRAKIKYRHGYVY
jgi:VWFA-related protein